MKLKDKISWLMGTVQQSLFPHLDDCLPTPKTAPEKHLGQDIVPMAAHEALRYNERTAAERCNGRFKGEFGGRCVQVRGPEKVMMHLMFGIVALFADQLLKVTGC